MQIDYAAMGAMLRAAREARGLTQAQVGRKLRMTGANVSLIERGAVETSLSNLQAFADLVGCSLCVLVAPPGDDRMQIAARVASILPALDGDVLALLRAWLEIWEAKYGHLRRDVHRSG